MATQSQEFWQEMSSEEYMGRKKGGSKFKNIKVKMDGYTFDSRAEAARYQELKLLLKARKITALHVHPPFELIPAFCDRNGKKIRKTVYKADFSYRLGRSKTLVIEDVKGVQTDVFKLKWKLLQRNYPQYDCRIISVKR